MERLSSECENCETKLKEAKEVDVMIGVTLEASPAQQGTSYLTQALNSRKLMTKEAVEQSLKFCNGDMNLSEALESIPDYKGNLTFTDCEIF